MQYISGMILLRVFFGKLLCALADNLLHLASCLVGSVQVGIVGQPHIDVRPILNIFGKERGGELGEDKAAQNQKEQGTGKKLPTVFDGVLCCPGVEPEEAAVAPLFEGFLD